MAKVLAMNGVKSAGGVAGGKLQEFEILFDDPLAVYTSGDEITGQIRIVLREPMKMRMVQLRFIGVSKVSWSEQNSLVNTLSGGKSKSAKKGGKNQPQQQQQPKFAADADGMILSKVGPVAILVPQGAVINGSVNNNNNVNSLSYATPGSKSISSKYSDEVVHLDKTIDLLERRPGQEFPADFVLPAGLNLLPFSFLLPKKPLPNSFESEHASVRYYCRAVIVKPWKHDHVTKRPFTVLSGGGDCKLANVENFPLLAHQLHVDEAVTSKSCCMTGKLICDLSVPKQVFNVGEPIPIAARLSNSTRRQVKQASFRLLQLITCKGRTNDAKSERTAVYCRTVAEKVYEKPVPRKSADGGGHAPAWAAETILKIPPVCSTTSTAESGWSTILNVDYQVQAELTLAGKRRSASKQDLVVRLPITIVGVPFITASQREYDKKVDKKPSTFSECHFGRVSIRDNVDNQFVRGHLDFAPYYSTLAN